jgi:hypothetical protein
MVSTTSGLLAEDRGKERGEPGLELGREHSRLRCSRLVAPSRQAVAGQRQVGQGRKMQVTHDSDSCQHLVTPNPNVSLSSLTNTSLWHS